MREISVFALCFLLPGLALLVFAPRLRKWNAHLFPRLYRPLEQQGALLVYYAVGVIWIILGFESFIVHR